MKYERKKFLKQLGIVVLIAVALKLLPGIIVYPLIGLINLVITVATLWILYRIITFIYNSYSDKYKYKRRPPRYWSDRR